MNNMIAGAGIGTLFVDRHLLIQRFTPMVTAIMNLIPSDIGRPISDITPRLKGDVDLTSVVATVVENLSTVEVQVEDGAGHVYQMRVQPYRTLDNVIEGAVLTFVDVTERHRLQANLDELSKSAAEAGEFAQSVLDTVREPQLVLDGNLKVVTVNKAFSATFKQKPDEVLGLPLSDIDNGAWHSPELLDLLLKVLPKKKELGYYQLKLVGKKRAPREVTLNALELIQAPGKRRLMLLTITSVDGA